ncbi:MAG: IspD/TarI family cytidylyltransferase [Brevinema sp.]
MQYVAIILASGSGSRYQSKIPKQFIKIHNQMSIEYTLKKFLPHVGKIILVVSKEYITTIKEHFVAESKIQVCEGGNCRQESVYKALCVLKADPPKLVAIHDGVRMLVSERMIQESFQTAHIYDSAIPIVPITDTLWYYEGLQKLSQSANRESYTCSQTPQTFNYQKILLAHQKSKLILAEFSDCAGVYIRSFGQVAVYPGDKRNIKLTSLEDKDFVEYQLMKNNLFVDT